MAIMVSLDDDDPSIKYNAWLDLPPSSCAILTRLADPRHYRMTADKYVTYLQMMPNSQLVSSERLLHLAKMLEMELKFDQAKIIYRVHVVQFPDDIRGWIGQAKIEKMHGNLIKAHTLYQEALTISPGNHELEADLIYLRHELYSEE